MKLPFALEINNKPNFFIQKIWKGLLENRIASTNDFLNYRNLHKTKTPDDWIAASQLKPKLHTIRRGKRWAVGTPIEFTIETSNDRSFTFAPEMPCKAIQTIQISYFTTFQVSIDGKVIDDKAIQMLAINDGFADINEFKFYFNQDFDGQIVHWTNFRY